MRLRQHFGRGHVIPPHQHATAYAAIVISGRYREVGDCGRCSAAAGAVIIHSPYHRHRDEIGETGASVLNVPLRSAASLRLRSGNLSDLDGFIRLLERGVEGSAALEQQSVLPMVGAEDLPDLLARDLIASPETEIGEWAQRADVSPRTLSRAFKSAFGMTAVSFRWRCRTRGAWRRIVEGEETLALIAHDSGFSDQAHLCRSIVAVTGRTPGHWRRVRLAD